MKTWNLTIHRVICRWQRTVSLISKVAIITQAHAKATVDPLSLVADRTVLRYLRRLVARTSAPTIARVRVPPLA